MLKVVEELEGEVVELVEVRHGIGEVVAGQALLVELQQGIGEVVLGQVAGVELEPGIEEVVVGQVVVVVGVKHVAEMGVE